MKSLVKILILSVGCMALIACGGSDSDDESGGFTGETSPAVATDENKQDLAEAGTLAAKQAIAGNSSPLAVNIDTPALDQANELIAALIQLNSLPMGNDFSAQLCPDGGSASASGDQNNATYTFNNCQSDGVTFDGSASYTTTSNGGFTITYSNFSVSFNGDTTTLNLTATCDENFNCTYSSDFTAENGKSYRVENSEVSGNDTSGYSVSATVYEPDHGRISFTSTGLLFDCANGNPSSGSITLTDSSSQVIVVSFTSCTEYSVTFDGSAETFTW